MPKWPVTAFTQGEVPDGPQNDTFEPPPAIVAPDVPAATVFAYPWGLTDYRAALPALAMVIVPALLMVSTIRFRSFKTIDSQGRKPYTVLLFVAGGIMLIATHPRFTLVAMAYSYLASAFVGMAITRVKHRGGHSVETPAAHASALSPTSSPFREFGMLSHALGRRVKTLRPVGASGLEDSSYSVPEVYVRPKYGVVENSGSRNSTLPDRGDRVE